MNIEILKRTSSKDVTFLKDVNNLIDVIKVGKFKHHYILNTQINLISDFINNLKDDSIYTIIPLISMFGKDEDQHIILSKHLISKLGIAIQDFDINNLETDYYLIFKFRKVIFDLSRLV